MNPTFPTRRQIIRTGAIAAALSAVSLPSLQAADAPAPVAKGDPFRGLKIGVASYTFKQRPLEPTILGIRKVGLSYVSIKDAHLPLKSTVEQRQEVAKKFLAAGITPLSCGVISLPNNEAAIRQAFEYARDAGIPTIVGSPAAEALPLVEACVKEFNIRVAIHNHGPEDKKWPSPNEVWAGVQKYDERIGLCIDVGHTAHAGVDPAESITKYHTRLYDVHFKDLEKSGPASAVCEVGRGVLDIRGMLQALIDIQYAHLVSFEYEKDMDDPLPGLAESVGFVRGVLSTMKA